MVPSHGHYEKREGLTGASAKKPGFGRVALEVAGPVTFTGNQAGGEERQRLSVQHNAQQIS